MSRIRIGLVGCGALGRIHADCLSKIKGAKLAACVDIVKKSAEAICAEFGDEGAYATTDVACVMDDPKIDAVYICTRHDSHAPLAIQAASAGKHILIEKPLALSMDQCNAVAHIVEQAGVFLMPAFKMRYYPLVRKAHEFIPDPMVVTGQMMDMRWSDEKWSQDPVQGGANVHSQGCHTTDLIRYFAGSEPQRVWAAGGSLTHPGHPCIDQCMASIQFVNGHVGSWIQGDAGLPMHVSKFFFQLFSGKGRCVQLTDRLKKATFTDGERTWVEQRDEEEGFQLENEQFIGALLEGREPKLTVHDAIQATRIVLAADAAIRTGQVQDIAVPVSV